MRILSQDGRIDLPYESIGISIRDKISVIAYPAMGSFDDGFWELAIYSTEAKARKAMEMLREAYCGNLHIYVDDFVLRAKNYDSRPEMLKLLNEMAGKVKYFQFPADNEVEV